MEIRLPDDYDPTKLAEIISKALTDLEGESKDKKMRALTTAGTQSPDIDEDELRLHIDGDTREVVFRNQGQTFVLTPTKR
jgi:hypothetical protein